MKFRTKRITIAAEVAIALASTLIVSTVQSQEAGPGSATTPVKDAGIQTVVVTAQKRSEDAGKVPISMSVIGGDELTAQHIGDYADLTRSIPNISFTGAGSSGDAGAGPGLSNFQIRGISSAAGSATVGLYLDDVSMMGPNLYSMGSPEPKFFDLDHVEVLRGPQGTLYGASSMGGTVKFITNQPDSKIESTDFYSEVSQTQGANTPNYNGNIVLNKPLIKNELAFRIGIQAEHQGGYINQLDANAQIIDHGINWQDNGTIHAALKWTPTKELTVTPNVIYQKVKTGDTDVSYSQLLSGGFAPAPTTPFDGTAAGNPVPLQAYQTSKTTHETGSDELLVPSLTVNYSTEIGDITSVSSYFRRTFSRVQDGTYLNSQPMALYNINYGSYPDLATAIDLSPASVILKNNVTQFSQELRLASKPYVEGGSPFTWVVGAYFSNGTTNVTETDFIYGINAAFNQAGVSPTAYPGAYNTSAIGDASSVVDGFPNDQTWYGRFNFHDSQQSIFGESSYYFTPGLHATVGLRYIRAQETFTSLQDLFFQGDAPTVNDISTSATKATPKFSVIWESSPTNSVYATAAEGFRLGGANSAVPWQWCGLNGPNPTSFAPDSLWSYELGDKARLFNNTVALNTSLFYVKWKNMQQELQLQCGFVYDTNVGSATSYGAEVELKVKPVSNLLIDLAAGYTHATLDDNAGADAGIPGATKGAAIPDVPNYNLALSGTYSFDISDAYLGFVRAAGHWIGASHGGLSVLASGDSNPDFNRPAYSTADISTGVSWNSWEATLFVKNLFNNNMVIQRPIEQSNQSGEVFRIAPREVGMSLSAKF